jgi:protein SOK2
MQANSDTANPYRDTRVRDHPLQIKSPTNLVPAEDEQEQDHEGEYAQTATPYGAAQSSYSYNPNSGSNPADISRVAEITSPQQNGSGRVTPRTSGNSASWQGGYPTPQRSNTAPASNLYNVVDSRDSANGAAEGYYSSAINGNIGSGKRGREDDDDDTDNKRQRTEHDEGGPVGGSTGSPYAVTSRPTSQRKR